MELKQKDNTAFKLVKVASELFSVHGYDGTSVRDICLAAGVSPSAVAYHYNNKQGLYDAVITQFKTDYKQLIGNMLYEPKSKEEFRLRLLMFLEKLLFSLLKDIKLYKHIMYQLEKEPCPLPTKVQEQIYELHIILVEFFEQAKQNEIIKKHIDSENVALVLFNSISNSIRGDGIKQRFTNKTLRDTAYRKQWLEQILQIFFHGVEAD